MISETYVLANIRKLDGLFSNANDPIEGLFFSKLAVLELCGWIEEAMDEIVLTSVHRTCADKTRWSAIETAIKKNSGFEYETHFRRLLALVIGEIGIQKVEGAIDQSKFTTLVAALQSLKGNRNTQAHTHIQGITRQIDAPSVTVSNFNKVYEGLIEYERTLMLVGY